MIVKKERRPCGANLDFSRRSICPVKAYQNRKKKASGMTMKIQRSQEYDDYLLIPKNIIYDTDLSAQCKIFLLYLYTQTKEGDCCFFTNENLSEFFNVDERTIRNWLSSLKKAGYIQTEFHKEGLTQKRVLSVNWKKLAMNIKKN